MANSSLELLKLAMKNRGQVGPISPLAEEMCKLLDHFRDQHCFDRDHYARVEAAQAEQVAELRQRLERIEGKGPAG